MNDVVMKAKKSTENLKMLHRTKEYEVSVKKEKLNEKIQQIQKIKKQNDF